MNRPWIEIEFTEALDISGVEIRYYQEFHNVHIRGGLEPTTMEHHGREWNLDKAKDLIIISKIVMTIYALTKNNSL